MSLIRIEHPEPCLRQLIFNRPEKGNALNSDLIQTLHQALLDADHDSKIICVILSGSGKHFCTGADLDAIRSGQFQPNQLAELLYTLATLSKPTLSLAKGFVVGGGVGLVACTDLGFAEENTQFSLPEIRLDLIPAMISPYLIQAIGYRRSQAWALKGETLSASTAARWGLIEDNYLNPQACLERIKHYKLDTLKALKKQWRSVNPEGFNRSHVQKTAQLFGQIMNQ